MLNAGEKRTEFRKAPKVQVSCIAADRLPEDLEPGALKLHTLCVPRGGSYLM